MGRIRHQGHRPGRNADHDLRHDQSDIEPRTNGESGAEPCGRMMEEAKVVKVVVTVVKVVVLVVVVVVMVPVVVVVIPEAPRTMLMRMMVRGVMGVVRAMVMPAALPARHGRSCHCWRD